MQVRNANGFNGIGMTEPRQRRIIGIIITVIYYNSRWNTGKTR